ncbi:hypothetical protein HYH02_004839 [Chlamydomonas schloesseri]|uniref:AF4/FMR2 C-terminal homology domain-containing protein n=1 Tax=Chlamydomonas schloesseri TaxID=2026947 RepID=A0A835WN78_9CHLO|nr:hypothetical protein HYH02_004839 [Chlamydomonas schloesseri]|eukprot:KAG2450334.1 hypothetical protein HYH02_004839 [Chlamydomonas schloesseri]
MASEAAGKRVIKIKLKLNGQTVARIGPGYAGPVARDGKDSKAGLLAQAQRRQAALRGYIPPSASADAIVARIRDGEGFAPGDELPEWDFSVLLPPCSQERPAKRARLVDVAEVPCTCGDHGPEPCSDKAHDRQAVQAAAARKTAQLPPGRADPAATAGGSGESNSDQATNSQAYLPLSPEDGGEGAARVGTAGGIPRPNASSAGQSALAAPLAAHQGKPAAAAQRQTAGPPAVAGRGATGAGRVGASKAAPTGAAAGPRSGSTAAPAASAPKAAAAPMAGAAAGDGPSSSGRPPRPPGVSVQTQTSGREFPVLPPLFLGLAGLNSQAAAYNSIGPFDLQLEHDARGGVGPADGRIDAHMLQARSTKKEGDALMARNGNVWTVKSMSKYVSGALMYMEAADALQRDHKHHNSAARAANLYRDTAVLLAHVANNADSIRAAGVVGKEALRLLAERLCAVCLMRQTMLMTYSFRSCEQKAKLALKEHQKQQAAAAATGSGGGTSVGQRPSPGDSNTSSLRAAANGAGASAADGGGSGGGGTAAGGLAGFSHEQVSELLTYARTTSKFSEYMRRSTKGLQDFMERADVQADQQAKLMCMHLAAVCMDMGMTPGLRVIHHAREAVRTLCEDFAR